MDFTRRLFYTSSSLFELTKGIVLVSVGVILVHLFVATIFIVDGVSMKPNFESGEIVVANRWTYQFGSPARGDVVVLRFPGDPDRQKYIKRLIGMPGETVEIKEGTVFINDHQLAEPYLREAGRLLATAALRADQSRWVLGDEEYFLIGDNRPNSNDSRIWGAAGREFLIGKAVLVIWPFGNSRIVPEETYDTK